MNKIQIKKCYPYDDGIVYKKRYILFLRQLRDVSFLKNFFFLEEIDITNNKITDISPLKNLTKLKLLDLRSNKIKDISPLKNLANLKELYLSNNSIPREQIKELQKALPNCKIYY